MMRTSERLYFSACAQALSATTAADDSGREFCTSSKKIANHVTLRFAIPAM
jgi:hypothetical protein